MKKRILSLLLSLAVALSVLPVTALAAAEESAGVPAPPAGLQAAPGPEAAAPVRAPSTRNDPYYSLGEDTTLIALKSLMDNIAATYVDSSDEWTVMSMAAYEDLFPDSPYQTSDAAKQAYINSAVSDAKLGKTDPGPGEYAKAVLSLSALGYDPAKLYPVNSNTPIDAGTGLKRTATAQLDAPYYYSTAPYALLAGMHDCAALSDAQTDALIALLKKTQRDDGLLGESTWFDSDTTGNSVAALAHLYGKNADAKAFIDDAITALSTKQLSTGSIDNGYTPNASTDACVIIGLAAMGVDPRTDTHFVKNSVSLLDGLFSHFQPDTNTFTGDFQCAAFRALIAAYRVIKTDQPFNVYDFTRNTSLAPARATGEGAASSPEEPTGEEITVTVTIKGLGDTYWLRDKSVSIPGDGAKVYHALTKALQGTSITQTGAESGYIRSMSRGGQTLGEFTHGENSGWLYKVNSELPNAGLTQYDISDGDSILWYYTGDWTQDPDAGSYEDPAPAAPQQPAPVPVSSFTDVDSQSYYYDALVWAVKAGITNGTGSGTFSPNEPCTRAQMMTFLWRAAGSPEPANTSSSFLDVDEDAYYIKALLWALERGITNGTGAAQFSPDAACTRAQMAVFLYRFAGSPAEAGGSLFTEVTESDYYYIPVSWAFHEGITNGTSATTYGPADPCTRAQMVTFLYRFLAD